MFIFMQFQLHMKIKVVILLTQPGWDSAWPEFGNIPPAVILCCVIKMTYAALS